MRDLVTDLLAGYRLTRVVLDDSRDFPPLVKPRAQLAKFLDKHPPWGGEDGVLGCPWCASWYVGLGIVAARRFAPKVWRPASLALAVSAAAGLLYNAEKRLEL